MKITCNNAVFKVFKTALLDLIKHNSKRLKAIPF